MNDDDHHRRCALCGNPKTNFAIETYYRGSRNTNCKHGHIIEPDSWILPPIRICDRCINYVTMPGGALTEMIENGQEAMEQAPANSGDEEWN